MIYSIIALIVVVVLLIWSLKRQYSLSKTLKKEHEYDDLVFRVGELENQKQSLSIENKTLETNISNNKSQLQIIETKKAYLSDNISDLEKQAKNAADIFYKQTMELANSRIEKDIDLEEQKFQKAIEDYRKEYETVLEDLNNQFKTNMVEKQSDMSTITNDIQKSLAELQDIREKVAIAIEAKKRAEQEGLEKDYYRCVITEADIGEIAKLRNIEPYFRNPRPISKIIWESYYKDSFAALLARLVPEKNSVSGIYKITNLTNDKVYIGQSVNLAERLRTHVKAGVGIDAPGLKLYQDMKKLGVENFSFEILERCPQAELNKKEKYWIEFFHSQDFGYNITKGGSQKISN